MKQPACAAATNSSGFVPTPSSKREPNEYWVLFNVVLWVVKLPLIYFDLFLVDFRFLTHKDNYMFVYKMQLKY